MGVVVERVCLAVGEEVRTLADAQKVVLVVDRVGDKVREQDERGR